MADAAVTPARVPPDPDGSGLPDIILEIDRLSAGYDQEPIVVDFSARIPAASVTTVIGPNGAGKSTLLRSIYGLNKTFGGSIRFLGRPIERLAPRERLRLGIGFVPQGRCNFPLMTVRENLELGAYTLPRATADEAPAKMLSMFPMLAAKLGVLAGNLSGGEQQILETAMVLEAGPRLLLLDEPSLGLSPSMQDQVFETIGELRGLGLTVLVIEQNAHGALEISDHGIVMELGRLFMMGPAREIIADPRIRIAYLGGAAPP
jgi:branched-chain amino acid transport system ATP-binding protein